MQIRKLSIGSDYKGGAMHYILGQEVLGGDYKIHMIDYKDDSIKVWIDNGEEIILWKEFNGNMPASIEFNINF